MARNGAAAANVAWVYTTSNTTVGGVTIYYYTIWATDTTGTNTLTY